jgi:hypothetical protein
MQSAAGHALILPRLGCGRMPTASPAELPCSVLRLPRLPILGVRILSARPARALWPGIAKLIRVKTGRVKVSAAAEANYLADVALAASFDELLARAQAAEREFRHAEATRAAVSVQYPLAQDLDLALTDVTRAAYAAQRAEIGPRGYDDRIYHRKAKATPAVHRWTSEAERLLTMRETHRLTGFPARPETQALGVEIAELPATGHA